MAGKEDKKEKRNETFGCLVRKVEWPGFKSAIKRTVLCIVAAVVAGVALSLFANLFETLSTRFF